MALNEITVQEQLEKILTSPVFLSTELLSRFLRFIVDHALAGREGWLKESVLGAEVFGRGPSFDPRTDPVVRVDARRLRTKLSEYYQTDGRLDPVIISLPKGGYVPAFARNDHSGTVLRTAPPPERSLAVLPFVSVSDIPGFEYFGDGLTEEVIAALAQIPEIQVAGRSAAFRYRGAGQDLRAIGEDLRVRLIIEGNVRRCANRVRMGAQMIDASTGFHRWSATWERELGDLFELQQEIAAAIAQRVSESL